MATSSGYSESEIIVELQRCSFVTHHPCWNEFGICLWFIHCPVSNPSKITSSLGQWNHLCGRLLVPYGMKSLSCLPPRKCHTTFTMVFYEWPVGAGYSFPCSRTCCSMLLWREKSQYQVPHESYTTSTWWIFCIIILVFHVASMILCRNDTGGDLGTVMYLGWCCWCWHFVLLLSVVIISWFFQKLPHITGGQSTGLGTLFGATVHTGPERWEYSWSLEAMLSGTYVHWSGRRSPSKEPQLWPWGHWWANVTSI